MYLTVQRMVSPWKLAAPATEQLQKFQCISAFYLQGNLVFGPRLHQVAPRDSSMVSCAYLSRYLLVCSKNEQHHCLWALPWELQYLWLSVSQSSSWGSVQHLWVLLAEQSGPRCANALEIPPLLGPNVATEPFGCCMEVIPFNIFWCFWALVSRASVDTTVVSLFVSSLSLLYLFFISSLSLLYLFFISFLSLLYLFFISFVCLIFLNLSQSLFTSFVLSVSLSLSMCFSPIISLSVQFL